MKFYGREKQLGELKRLLARKEGGVGLIYGRRRVGKSELIKQCLREEEVRSIYFECKCTTEGNNVESLCALVSEALGLPKLGFASVEELVEFLYRQGEREALVLVLDEYPYLRSAVAGLDSILQSLIDKYAATSRTKLILCGSYVDVMKSLLLSENPLYGRVDLTIDLKPMDYYESALFYPAFSPEDKVRLFAVFGGIPYFNRLIDSSLTVRENIIALIASPGARLENEVSMYLASQISKITNANEVFEALAKGYTKFSDILSQSHVSSSPTLADVLEKLMRMEVVERTAPINDPDNKRKASYRISDQLSLFYYRYVFPFASQMSVMDPEVFYDRYIAESFEAAFVPAAFEVVCRQYLIRMNRKGRLDEVFDVIGKYYYDDPASRTNGEFDIVTRDPRGYIFYEAKFRREPVSRSMMDAELRQVEATALAPYRCGFISRSGFSCPPKERELFLTLDDLYAEG